MFDRGMPSLAPPPSAGSSFISAPPSSSTGRDSTSGRESTSGTSPFAGTSCLHLADDHNTTDVMQSAFAEAGSRDSMLSSEHPSTRSFGGGVPQSHPVPATSPPSGGEVGGVLSTGSTAHGRASRTTDVLEDDVQLAVAESMDAGPLANPLFVCPLTMDIMEDPVVAEDGRVYERFMIEDWLKVCW